MYNYYIMARKIKKSCKGSKNRSMRSRCKKLSVVNRKKKIFNCGCRKRRQSRKLMRGSGYGMGSGSGLGGAPISTNKVLS